MITMFIIITKFSVIKGSIFGHTHLMSCDRLRSSDCKHYIEVEYHAPTHGFLMSY